MTDTQANHAATEDVGMKEPVQGGSSGRTGIIVLGPHRSGTSALTRVLSLLGADLPQGLMPSREDNPEGFWESWRAQQLDDEILDHLGLTWDSTALLPTDWRAKCEEKGFTQRCLDALRDDFGSSPLFVLKEPRMCRLFPIWRDAMTDYGAHTTAILPLRNPLEVAVSLQARDGFSTEKGLILWLLHSLEAEASSRALPRFFLTFDDLLKDWRALAGAAAEALGISWVGMGADAPGRIDQFLNAKMRHQKVSDDAVLASTFPYSWVRDSYHALLRLRSDPYDKDARAMLDEIRTQISAGGGLLSAALNDESRKLTDVRDAMAAVEEEKGAALALVARLDGDHNNLLIRLRATDAAGETARGHVRVLEDQTRQLQSRMGQLQSQNSQLRSQNSELQSQNNQHRSENLALQTLVTQTRNHWAATALSLSDIQGSRTWQTCKPLLRLERRFPAASRYLTALPRVLYWLLTGQYRSRMQLHREVVTISKARLFDSRGYVTEHPEITSSGYAPILHWLLIGWKDGLDPHPLFRTGWVLETNPDLAEAGVNPLVHYLTTGAGEGRDPHPLFDTDWYLTQNPDVATAGVNPLAHFIGIGAVEGRDPHPMFDSSWYLRQYPRIAAEGGNPLVDYLTRGWREGHDPSPEFSTRAYLDANPDVAAANVNPLLHYITKGKAEARPLRPSKAASEDGPLSDEALVRKSAFFDPKYYAEKLADTAAASAASMDPAEHFCTHGWREGRNPSPDFSTSRYLVANPDVLELGINPLVHYERIGSQEGRPITPTQPTETDAGFEEDLEIEVSGTDIMAIALFLPQFHRIPENDEWWGAGFTEWSNTRKTAPRFDGHHQPRTPHPDMGHYDLSDVRTLEKQARLARRHGIHGFCFYHYWFDGQRLLEKPVDLLLAHPEIDISFCLCWANENWTRRWDGLDNETLIAQNHSEEDDLAFITDLAKYLRDLRYIRVDGKPFFLIYRLAQFRDMKATADRWRGWCRENGIGELYLAYVKSFHDTKPPAEYGMDAVVEFPPLSVAQTGNTGLLCEEHQGTDASGDDRVRDYASYAVGLSYFPDRPPGGDFYRCVTLDWDNSARRSSGATLFSGFTPELYAQWLQRAETWTRRHHPRDRRFVFINAWNEWAEGTYLEPDDKYGYRCLNETSRVLGGEYEDPRHPKVSVVVPNYNHADYLRQRLDSIYNQSYENLEVILMDDCSLDTSRAILKEYAARYPKITRLVFNTVNSGGVFRQWGKGIGMATGELVWIAESDDVCDLDFLETLVPYLANDEAVNFAYAKTEFVDEQGAITDATVDDYLAVVSTEKWRRSYVNASHREVTEALAVRNTVPNVSSVIFRKPIEMPLLKDEEWKAMKICGDWIFYLHLARGGRIAYSIDTKNYFRRHGGSTSSKTYQQEVYYLEHEKVARTIAALYDVPKTALLRNGEIIRDFWTKMARDTCPFDELYDFESVLEAGRQRSPNILISLLAFWAGGAEIFPIRLANELKRRGYAITVHSFDLLEQDDRVRTMLRSDIPVVKAKTTQELLNLIQTFGIEILNTHHQAMQDLYAKLTKEERSRSGVKHVATSHGIYEVISAEYLRTNLAHIDDAVDLWTCVAEKNKKPFQDLGLYEPRRFVKIGNGMEMPPIVPVAREDLDIAPDAFVICVASRAIPEKGWREAIGSIDKARQLSHRDIHLLLLGNGPVYDELRTEKLPRHIHLLGFREDPINYYACADMGMLPSYYAAESFPLTIIESLFAGKPVIASNVGEIRNILRAEGGTAGAVVDLVEGRVPMDKLATVVASFAADQSRYRAAASLVSRIAERYEIGCVADQYLAAYEHAVQRPDTKALLNAEAL